MKNYREKYFSDMGYGISDFVKFRTPKSEIPACRQAGRNPKSANRGFTLVEVLIAIGLIIVGIWLLMNAFMLGSDGIVAAKRRVEALNYAQEVMENCIIPVDFDNANLNVSSPLAKETYDDAASACFDDTGLNYTRTYDVWYVDTSDLEGIAGSITDYKRVQVKVVDDTGQISDITLDTLKTDFQDLE